jgi:NAD(P)-dependent dehydrogenase (short-subunit alcohol dehydrogenase family)
MGNHYAVSKARIIEMTRVLSFELGPYRIRINAIAPGGVNTKSADYLIFIFQPKIRSLGSGR